jgi:hypothetical protein
MNSTEPKSGKKTPKNSKASNSKQNAVQLKTKKNSGKNKVPQTEALVQENQENVLEAEDSNTD